LIPPAFYHRICIHGFVWVLYPKIGGLPRHIVLTGVVYGIFIWAVMNFIVVPSSQVPKGTFNLLNSLKAMLILIFMLGLPLSFLGSRFFDRNRYNLSKS